MALIDCPECGRQVSSAAEACPQCGYPISPVLPLSTEPSCYACSGTSTTRCQSCGKFSCAMHLEPIFVHYYYRRGGASELRCQSCVKQAEGRQRIWAISVGISLGLVVVVGVVTFATIGSVTTNVERERKEYERIRKETDPIMKDIEQKRTQRP